MSWQIHATTVGHAFRDLVPRTIRVRAQMGIRNRTVGATVCIMWLYAEEVQRHFRWIHRRFLSNPLGSGPVVHANSFAALPRELHAPKRRVASTVL